MNVLSFGSSFEHFIFSVLGKGLVNSSSPGEPEGSKK